MNRDKIISADAAGLRRKAEEMIASQPPIVNGLDEKRLLHELQVHQVELEMQNQELRQVQAELIESEKACRSASQDLEAMLKALPDLMFKVDREGCLLEYYSSAGHLLYLPPDQFLGKRVSDVLPEEAARIIMEALDEAAEKGVCRGAVYSLQMPSGQAWYEISIAAMRVVEQPGAHFIMLSRDITERIEYENEKLKMEKLASLGVMAGGIANDFNSIMTSVLGNITFAQMHLDSTHKAYKPLVKAEKASLRASLLAQKLITFSRGGEPVRKAVSLQRLVSESIWFTLHGSNVKGVVDIPDTVHAVLADEGLMSHVFNCIVTNATQAMPDGGILKITAQNEYLADRNSLHLQGGSYVRLSFIDHGCGMSDAVLKKIFDPYFTTRPDGSGFGLATVLSIVTRHGGYISASSVVNRGTIFSILLPSTGEAYPIPQTDSAKEASGYYMEGSVIVMDDEKIILGITSEMLGFIGYNVTTCESGEELVAKYKAARETGKPFSAAIIDLNIPCGMGGKEAARQIMAIDPEACLIVSSGYLNNPVLSDFRAYGFSGVLRKPYSMNELDQLLLSLLSDSNK